MTEKDNIESRISVFMWHLGRILTDMMIISNETDSPIILQTFQTGSNLFDTLGKCIYSTLSYGDILPALNEFIKSLDYDSAEDFNSTLQYAHDFSKDFLVFLEENNLK